MAPGYNQSPRPRHPISKQTQPRSAGEGLGTAGDGGGLLKRAYKGSDGSPTSSEPVVEDLTGIVGSVGEVGEVAVDEAILCAANF
jgi:hypothetical protein